MDNSMTPKTRITYDDRRKLLALVNAYASATQKAGHAEEGSKAFGTPQEAWAVADAVYQELSGFVFGLGTNVPRPTGGFPPVDQQMGPAPAGLALLNAPTPPTPADAYWAGRADGAADA